MFCPAGYKGFTYTVATIPQFVMMGSSVSIEACIPNVPWGFHAGLSVHSDYVIA